MEISVAELSTNTDKYVDMAKDQDILIMKEGIPAAKLISTENPKLKALRKLKGILPRDLDIDAIRMERILG